MISYADDQIVVAKPEDPLQRNIFKLNKLCNIYNLIFSSNITKVMAFPGKKPIKLKIVLEDQIVDKLNHYNYRGCNISFENDNDICNKISKVPKNTSHNKMKIKYEAYLHPTLFSFTYINVFKFLGIFDSLYNKLKYAALFC
jgi:hypothetical protein